MNWYYLLAFVAFIITSLAQVLISSRYAKYKNVLNAKKMDGFEAAKKVLDDNGLSDIYIVETEGYLADHYDSSAKVIRLSRDVFHGDSVAAVAIALHEVGHALQYKEGNKLLDVRSKIYPIVNFGSRFGYIVIILGLSLSMLQLFYAGILLLATILVFQLLTLPVEFDASKRALENLEKYEILDKDELEGASRVLVAAALTYVAALASTVIEIIRLLLLASRDRD